MTVVISPLQTAWLAIALTTGVGSTVIVNEVVGPVHGPADGVTTMVATTATPPLLTAVNAGMSPMPLAARPIEGVSLVHAKLVAVPVKLIVLALVPLQTSWSITALTDAAG